MVWMPFLTLLVATSSPEVRIPCQNSWLPLCYFDMRGSLVPFGGLLSAFLVCSLFFPFCFHPIFLTRPVGSRSIEAQIQRTILESQGVALCYSITSAASFKALDTWIQKKHDVDSQTPWSLGDRCAVLVGLHSDSDIDNSKREVSFEEGIEKAKKLNIPFVECSARDDINIRAIFRILIEDCYYLHDQLIATQLGMNPSPLVPPQSPRVFVHSCSLPWISLWHLGLHKPSSTREKRGNPCVIQ